MKNKNLITESAGGQAVTDVDRSLIPGDLVEAGINFRLRDRVQSRRGLVEDDKVSPTAATTTAPISFRRS